MNTTALHACANLSELRVEIDQIDRAIVELLAKREHYIRQAASFKATRADVMLVDRIEDVVVKTKAHAKTIGADPVMVERTYRALIAACIHIELSEFDRLSE